MKFFSGRKKEPLTSVNRYATIVIGLILTTFLIGAGIWMLAVFLDDVARTLTFQTIGVSAALMSPFLLLAFWSARHTYYGFKGYRYVKQEKEVAPIDRTKPANLKEKWKEFGFFFAFSLLSIWLLLSGAISTEDWRYWLFVLGGIALFVMSAISLISIVNRWSIEKEESIYPFGFVLSGVLCLIALIIGAVVLQDNLLTEYSTHLLVVGAIVLAIIILQIGYRLGFKVAGKANEQAQGYLEDCLQSEKTGGYFCYLSVLRRELANEIMNRDANKYLQNYKQLLGEKERLDRLSKNEIDDRLKVMNKDYSHYEYFDKIGTRDYVLYDDAFGSESIEDLIKAYNAIVNFTYMTEKSEPYWNIRTGGISGEELIHLKEYVSRFRDTILLAHLHHAKRDYDIYTSTEPRDPSYENDRYVVTPLPARNPAHEYGVFIKCLDQYGIFETFYGDDDKNFNSFYRSDSSFEERRSLDGLGIRSGLTSEKSLRSIESWKWT